MDTLKMKFGQIKFFAHQSLKGIPIPIFKDNNINRQIDKHINRIIDARTKRK
jgi:hypothetical protein